MSQLDHAIAKRPTGSIFKPFVYAAPINTAVTGQTLFANASADPNTGVVTNADGVFTPASLIDDSQVSIAITATRFTSRATITRPSTAKSQPATPWRSR